MRILFVNNRYPPAVLGGYERECAGVADHLRLRHDVHVLTTTVGRDAAAADDSIRRELTLLTPNAKGTLRTPLGSLRDVKTARRTLAEVKPDLVWVWNGASLPHAALRVIADSGVPVAYRVCEHWFAGLFVADRLTRHIHPVAGDEPGLWKGWGTAMRALNRLPSLRIEPQLRHRAAICWNSEALKGMVPTPPMIDPVLERINHVSSSNLPALAALARDPDDVPLVVFVGRITEEKGVNTVVRALARLRDEHGITARYELAGPVDDADPQLVQRAAAAAGVADAVVVHPPLDTAGVARLLARASVQVVPSIWMEPYPIVSIEAATARVPLVATDVGGIPEFIRDGVDGLLYPADDDAALARAIARTLTDPEGTAARVVSARERAASHQWDVHLVGMEQFAVDALHALREP